MTHYLPQLYHTDKSQSILLLTLLYKGDENILIEFLQSEQSTDNLFIYLEWYKPKSRLDKQKHS